MRGVLLLLAYAACSPAFADEGMWTFDNFPAASLKQAYGVELTPAWLEHVRLSTLRLPNCTASFVSSEGLMITNHHCVESCLAQLSSRDKDLEVSGFSAPERHEEQFCASQQADVLVGTEDITAQVLKATAHLSDAEALRMRSRTLTALEQNCEMMSARSRSGKLKCQAVKLYQGGQFVLYKYHRYDEIRLVFAPESDMAEFGGDPDNFQFPRWSLDFAMLRAYENGRPAKTPNFLRVNFAGPAGDSLVFVAGYPAATVRLQTRAQLEFERSMVLPLLLTRISELRGRYIQFGSANAADERAVHAPLNSLQNILKVRRKELDALNDPALFIAKGAQEQELRRNMDSSAGDPWRDIENATTRERPLYLPYTFLEVGAGFMSVLFRDARWLVRAADERLKPNAERLREFTDSAIVNIERDLGTRAPVYPAFEQLTLSFSLDRMREWLGPDYPAVRRMLVHESPNALANRLIAETKLDDTGVRRQLWIGGKAAIDASRDPMIELARSVDADSRALRREYEDAVEAPIFAAGQKIAAVRFAVYGNRIYPDATFTLRINYGTVRGWSENGVDIQPFTYLAQIFERATGAVPFKVPDTWWQAKDRLDLRTPFCISTNNDIIGGNSGSALIDAGGEWVGLMFDGNIHSIAGRYWFNPADNRAVALHPAMIREALDKVYGAQYLLAEMSR